ncbi:hypothetical protein BJV78DRAFT_1283425 [Lactifluus subvellereus]|nr:hypothetical protein BJV78DRAFT_1283425 [Lactifluus subvellereus]
MPGDVVLEKEKTLEALGADVERVRPTSIVEKEQNLAREYALDFTSENTNEASEAGKKSDDDAKIALGHHYPSSLMYDETAKEVPLRPLASLK